MKTPFYKKCEIVTALMLICVILFFCVTTVVKEGRYIAVSAKKNSIDTASEEDSIFLKVFN